MDFLPCVFYERLVALMYHSTAGIICDEDDDDDEGNHHFIDQLKHFSHSDLQKLYTEYCENRQWPGGYIAIVGTSEDDLPSLVVWEIDNDNCSSGDPIEEFFSPYAQLKTLAIGMGDYSPAPEESLPVDTAASWNKALQRLKSCGHFNKIKVDLSDELAEKLLAELHEFVTCRKLQVAGSGPASLLSFFTRQVSAGTLQSIGIYGDVEEEIVAQILVLADQPQLQEIFFEAPNRESDKGFGARLLSALFQKWMTSAQPRWNFTAFIQMYNEAARVDRKEMTHVHNAQLMTAYMHGNMVECFSITQSRVILDGHYWTELTFCKSASDADANVKDALKVRARKLSDVKQ